MTERHLGSMLLEKSDWLNILQNSSHVIIPGIQSSLSGGSASKYLSFHSQCLSPWVFTKEISMVCSEQRFLLWAFIIKPVKAMVSFSLLDEALCAAVGPIKALN